MNRTLGEWLKEFLPRACLWVPATALAAYFVANDWRGTLAGAVAGLSWAMRLTRWNFRDELEREELGAASARARRNHRKSRSLAQELDAADRVMSSRDRQPFD